MFANISLFSISEPARFHTKISFFLSQIHYNVMFFQENGVKMVRLKTKITAEEVNYYTFYNTYLAMLQIIM